MRPDAVTEWLEKMERKSRVISSYVEGAAWDDSLGWRGVLKTAWSTPSQRPSGLLLVGPEGCGKHTAAAHMHHLLLDEFPDRDRCRFWHLTGGDLQMGAEDFSALEDRVDAILTRASADRLEQVCLIVEQIETMEYRTRLLDYLGEIVCDYSLAERDPSVEAPGLFLILIEREELPLPSLLRQLLRLIRFKLPTREQRMQYLKNTAQDLRGYISLDQLAAETERYTMAQLADVTDCIRNHVDLVGGVALDAGELTAILQTQSPEPTGNSAQNRIADFLETLPAVLTEAFSKLPAAMPVQAAAAPAQTAAQTESLSELSEQGAAFLMDRETSRERERLEQMDFKDFAREYFKGEVVVTYREKQRRLNKNLAQ